MIYIVCIGLLIGLSYLRDHLIEIETRMAFADPGTLTERLIQIDLATSIAFLAVFAIAITAAFWTWDSDPNAVHS